MKTLAIIGAGYLQLPLVRRARELGLRTICFAWADGANAAREADLFYPISVTEHDKIIAICRAENVAGVCSIASDIAVPAVAAVAEALGLPGNSVESARLTAHKGLMRKRLAERDIPCPEFRCTAGNEPISIRFPAVVKPADRSGSLGVCMVNDPKHLGTALKKALDISHCHEAVVEEFTGGVEVSVETISFEGNHYLVAITDKVTSGKPHFVELAHHQPSRQAADTLARLRELAFRALDAFGIRHGAGHTEFIIAPGGALCVIEVSARMGGDFIGSDLVPMTTGYDFVGAVIQAALGEFVPPPAEIRTSRKGAGVWFYTIHTPDVYTLMNSADPRIVRAELKDRFPVSPLTCSKDRSGYFIYSAEHRWDLPLKIPT